MVSALLGENIQCIKEKCHHYDFYTISVRHGKGLFLPIRVWTQVNLCGYMDTDRYSLYPMQVNSLLPLTGTGKQIQVYGHGQV